MPNTKNLAATYPLSRIMIWALLFQLAWNWGRLVAVFKQGELTGPDDFLRLHQVQNWMAGQGWYDLSASRMFPPNGADIHWSRLVDVPIATLIWLLDLVFETETATRIATILWPTLLFVGVVVVVTLTCDRVLKNYNRLLPLIFAALCVSSVFQFAPGRIDHHNVQILLFSLTILGLVARDTSWGDYLMGFAIAFSISIGLDTAALYIIILAYLAYEWAIGHDGNGRGLVKIALAIAASTLVLFILNFPPDRYMEGRCDANSAFYATGLWLLSGAFLLMAAFSQMLRFESLQKQFLIRTLIGGGLGITAVVTLLMLFPDCLNGPYGALSEEAKTRWLSTVGEAKTLPAVLKQFPSEWFRTVGYLIAVLLAGLYVLFSPKYFSAKLVALYIVLVACALGTIWQVRILRTGIYVSIPFCVIIADMSWRALIKRFADTKILAYGLQFILVATLVSATWSWAGTLIMGDDNPKSNVVAKAENSPSSFKRNAPTQCFASNDYKFLAGLPKGVVMTDLYSATAALVFSPHTVIAGPYHRNERGILDVLDFFETDTEKAHALVEKYNLDYVSFCMNSASKKENAYPKSWMAGRIQNGDLPVWLQEVSPNGSVVKVLKVLR